PGSSGPGSATPQPSGLKSAAPPSAAYRAGTPPPSLAPRRPAPRAVPIAPRPLGPGRGAMAGGLPADRFNPARFIRRIPPLWTYATLALVLFAAARWVLPWSALTP